MNRFIEQAVPYGGSATRECEWSATDRRSNVPVRRRAHGGRTALTAAVLAVAALYPTVGPADLPSVRSLVPPRVGLMATYLIPPTNFGIPAFTFVGEQLVQVSTPYITAAQGGTPPTNPLLQVDYPASFTDNTSVQQGVAALKAEIAAQGDPSAVVFGYSQGARVLAVYKRDFNAQYTEPAAGTTVPTPTFVMIGNSNRPNGGFSTRLAFLGLGGIGGTVAEAIPTPTQTAGAAEGQITTHDYVHQYDGFADFPNRPLNAFALLNAVLGLYFGHATYGQVSPADAVLQDKFGDTAYYMIPARVLPLLRPLQLIGVPEPLLAVLDAPLRVLVEAGFDRTISPGRPASAELLPIGNPLALALNFALALPTGLDDGLQKIGLGRPFGTKPAGPYGVGGPPVTLPGSATLPTAPRIPTTERLATDNSVVAAPSSDAEGAELVSGVGEVPPVTAVSAGGAPAPTSTRSTAIDELADVEPQFDGERLLPGVTDIVDGASSAQPAHTASAGKSGEDTTIGPVDETADTRLPHSTDLKIGSTALSDRDSDVDAYRSSTPVRPDREADNDSNLRSESRDSAQASDRAPTGD